MWLDIQIFGFRALWSPYFLTFIIALAVTYFLITGPMRHKFGKGLPKPTILQQVFFYLAMLLLYAVKGAPIDLLSHIMMSAHMTQMAILYFVIPIFIIRGIPEWILRSLVILPFLKPLFIFFIKQIFVLVIFNCFFAMYLIPMIFDLINFNQPFHIALHCFYLLPQFLCGGQSLLL